MIYQKLINDDPIKQGDLFSDIPKIDLSFSQLTVLNPDDGSLMTSNWKTSANRLTDSQAISAVLPISRMQAMVISQNCDCTRGEYIYLAEIGDYLTFTKQEKEPKNANKWQKLILKISHTNPRYFYLPADPSIGLKTKMAVDFRVVVRVSLGDLLSWRNKRIAGLNDVATEHLRECLSHFIGRYAYNEWYPLNAEEVAAYAENSRENIQPYSWQTK